jgi:hypothetical protein
MILDLRASGESTKSKIMTPPFSGIGHVVLQHLCGRGGPTMSASGTAVFVGQAAQLRLLRKSLATARRSQPCIVVVDALPRIGKSTLLRSPHGGGVSSG